LDIESFVEGAIVYLIEDDNGRFEDDTKREELIRDGFVGGDVKELFAVYCDD
jgi:hypothetical protein